MEFAALGVQFRIFGFRGDLRRQCGLACRRAPKPFAADVLRDSRVEHLRDVLAPLDPSAHLRRGEILQRSILQHGDASGETPDLLAVAGIDVYRVFEYFFVLLPAVEPFELVGAHQDRKLHLRAVVLGQIAQRVDCVRGFGQQKLHHRRFDPLRQARCGAGPFRHLEAVHFGRQFGGPLVGALGRDDEHRFVAQSLLHDIFGQGDMAFVYGVERPEIEHYALHDRPVMNSSMMRVVSAMASSSESFTTM